MANQIIIDIGAAANDGTGDPLRTAFNYVNDNFSNIWATGVANSNVAFDGNKILTANTNGNLILAPNGIGKVQSNVDIRPNANNTLSLGSSALRWNSVYTQNLNVGGDLTVTGNIIEMGNIVTDAKTIQLANTAADASSANGSGITVGANDNIATILYDSTSNTWGVNIGVSAVGNITAPYFIGNGSQLTGLPATYSNTNATSLLASFGSNTISTTGNITAGYLLGNGSQLTGITTYANANAVAYGESGWAGNIIPSGNAVYSLGNATNQWKSLYVSNTTIYINNVPIGLTAGNVLTVNGADVVTTNGNGVTALGNIGIVGDAIYDLNGIIVENADLSHGATASMIIPSNGNTTVPFQLNNTYGNITIGTGPSSTITSTWTFDSNGTLNFPDNSGQGWPINKQRYGMGNLVAWLDGEWTIGEYAGNVGGATGIRIDPAIEGPVGMTFPSTTSAVTQPVQIYSTAGSGIRLYTGPTWDFTSTGTFTKPNNVYESTTGTVTCTPGVPTVILSSVNSSIRTIKLIIQVEGKETSLNYDTQSCEMLVARSVRNNNVIGSVYGLTYTSNNPLATFNAAYNASTNMIDVTCTPISGADPVYVRLTVTQITAS